MTTHEPAVAQYNGNESMSYKQLVVVNITTDYLADLHSVPCLPNPALLKATTHEPAVAQPVRDRGRPPILRSEPVANIHRAAVSLRSFSQSPDESKISRWSPEVLNTSLSFYTEIETLESEVRKP